MTIPAWQTDDLGEEWVESSPSPPPSLKAPLQPSSTETLPRHDPASIRAKRGSLRALGHSAARSLPPSRSASSPQSGSPRVISGHGEGRILSEKVENNNNGLTLPSPPMSDQEKDGGAGTFVVKDGVDDDRGRHLAKKGKDIFGASALEKMFRPPSPVPEEPTPTPSTPSPATSAPNRPEEIESIRKASNPYAPTNPSRLSKSVTPSSVSSSFSVTLPHPDESQDITAPMEEGETESSLIVDVERDRDTTRELKSGEVETDMSLPRPGQNYPFTFSHPVDQDDSKGSNSDPSLSPFNPEDKSHSTMHHQSTHVKPGLRLFRSAYDTYTREHLSALVDSIAIDASPSPPPLPAASLMRRGSRLASEGSSSGGGNSLGSRGSETDDSRSSKRMRMSPSSPARRPNGIRDWAAEGRAMMDRIRNAAGSTTTESVSHSQGQSGESRI